MKILVVNALQITNKDDGMGKYAITIIEFLEKNYSDKLQIYYIATNEGRERIKALVNSDRLIEFGYNKSDSIIKKFYMENIKIVSLLKNIKVDFYWSLDGKLPLFDFEKYKNINNSRCWIYGCT